MLHQTNDERGGRQREKETVQRKSQVAGVREETERIEARRNRGIGRRKEEGIELSSEVFCSKVNESIG